MEANLASQQKENRQLQAQINSNKKVATKYRQKVWQLENAAISNWEHIQTMECTIGEQRQMIQCLEHVCGDLAARLECLEALANQYKPDVTIDKHASKESPPETPAHSSSQVLRSNSFSFS